MASVGLVPSVTRLRASHGWTVTRPVWTRRLALPDPKLVQNPSLPSARGTTHTGVLTGVPSRRKAVNRRYFCASRAMPGGFRDASADGTTVRAEARPRARPAHRPRLAAHTGMGHGPPRWA